MNAVSLLWWEILGILTVQMGDKNINLSKGCYDIENGKKNMDV